MKLNLYPLLAILLIALLSLIIFLLIFQKSTATPSGAGEIQPEIINLDIPFKALYAEPSEKAKVVYRVPIGVRLTGKTSDESWYRVRLSYKYFGYQEHEGWARVK